jgi:RimJ/RimL family protein N-acetyltransferase
LYYNCKHIRVNGKSKLTNNKMEFNFDNKYILEDKRVILKPLELTDFKNLISFSTNEPEIWKYSLIQAVGENGLKNYLNLAIQARNERKEYPFIVFDKLTNSFAGSTRFYDIQLANKCLQLGFTWYGKQFQGTGLNKHCKKLMLEFAFEKMEIERVEFRADNDNKRSIYAMKSIGCVEEGILRSNGMRSDGTRRDSIVLSILKSEWEMKTKDKLEEKIENNASH